MHPQSTNPTPATLGDDEFSALFPVMRNADLARQLGVSVSTVSRRARALGLTKDPETRYAHTRQPKSDETRARMSAGMKGRTFSDETRAKMSAAQTGRTLTPEWRANISKGGKGKPKPASFVEKATGRRLSDEVRKARKARMAERGTLPSGSRHYAWKGGVVPKPFARFANPEYAAWRKDCLERDGYTCQDCGRVFAPGQRGLHVHHLRPFAKFPEVRLNRGNGVTICTACHRLHHAFVHVLDYERIEQVPCACGCGEMMYPMTEGGKPRRYIRYHGRRGKSASAQTRAQISASLKGRARGPFSEEHKQHISEGRKGIGKGVPSPNKGWRNTYVTQEEFITLYPTMSATALAARCHSSAAFVSVWARKLGLAPRYARPDRLPALGRVDDAAERL